MRNAYVEAERAITAELKALSKRIDAAVAAGLPIESAWSLRRLEIDALLRRIADEINGFAELAAKTTSAQQSLFAGLGVEHAQALAKAAGVTAGFRRLNESALVDLMGSLERGSPLYDLFRELGPRAASHARTVFAKAAVAGANPRATAKALVKDIRGLSSTRALVIARTETMRSYRTATQRSFAANAGVITGWRWMAAHQPRTCAMCLAMDGTVHGVDEVMHSHPACRCAMVPLTAYSNPPRETGAQWLQRQPESVQLQVLGPTKLELWKSGKISLSDLVRETEHPRWGRGRQEATITQALSKAGHSPAKTVLVKGAVIPPPPPRAPSIPTASQPPESSKFTLGRWKSWNIPDIKSRNPSKQYELAQVKSWTAVEKEILETAVPYIDRTFALTPVRPLRIGFLDRFPEANGSFDPDLDIIRVSTHSVANHGNPQGMALSFTHEWAHALDSALGSRNGTKWASSAGATPESREWLLRVMASPSYRYLESTSKGRAGYFRSTHECFSRCMEMMMAKDIGGESVKAMDQKRKGWISEGYPAYWDWTEFEPILEAFKAWLRAEGVLK